VLASACEATRQKVNERAVLHDELGLGGGRHACDDAAVGASSKSSERAA
jgi:hypothetical protein